MVVVCWVGVGGWGKGGVVVVLLGGGGCSSKKRSAVKMCSQ